MADEQDLVAMPQYAFVTSGPLVDNAAFSHIDVAFGRAQWSCVWRC